MTLQPENTSRKLDNLGRIVIPKGLRNRLGISDGEDLEFFTTTIDGVNYICLTNNHIDTPRYREAALVLEELGIPIPKDLLNKIK